MQHLQIDDFLHYHFLSGIRHSPDGKHACFAVHKADFEENRYQSNLWLYSAQDNSTRSLTSFGEERMFAWLNDGRHILFSGVRKPKDKKKKKQGEALTIFYRIPIDGGEAQEAFRLQHNVTGIRVIDDDRFLLTVDYDPAEETLKELHSKDAEEAKQRRKEEQNVEVIEEIPFWQNGKGFTSGHRSRLYLYDTRDGSMLPLTEPEFQVSGAELNPSCNQAAVTGQVFQGRLGTMDSLYLLDLDTQEWTALYDEQDLSFADAHFISDTTIVAAASTKEHYGLNENPRFYRLDRNDNSITLITPEFDASVRNTVGSDCRFGPGPSMQVHGSHLYFLTTEGYHSFINRVDSAGNVEKLSHDGGSADAFSVSQNQILFIGLRGLALQELYAVTDSGEQAITQFNAWLPQQRFVQDPEYLPVDVDDETMIDGWVLKPVNFDKGGSFPGILNIHGGPKTVYSDVFVHEMQYWANQGYFVFFCNPRGSDGKGNAFADIRGRFGTIDYEDLMAFTDAAAAKYPSLDQDRIGVTGGSYGGFMTNWIIGHTHRFAAAVSQRSISNWISKFGTTDIGYFFNADQIGATPWDDLEKLWFHSPLQYADQVKTPTLFIHAEEDYRCWLPEGLQMFTALRYHGVKSRLCMFRGENHELSRSGRPKARIRRLKEITQWFQSHLEDSK